MVGRILGFTKKMSIGILSSGLVASLAHTAVTPAVIGASIVYLVVAMAAPLLPRFATRSDLSSSGCFNFHQLYLFHIGEFNGFDGGRLSPVNWIVAVIGS